MYLYHLQKNITYIEKKSQRPLQKIETNKQKKYFSSERKRLGKPLLLVVSLHKVGDEGGESL